VADALDDASAVVKMVPEWSSGWIYDWANMGNNSALITIAATPKPTQGSAEPFGPRRANNNAANSKIRPQFAKPIARNSSASVGPEWRGRGSRTEIKNKIGAITTYALNGNSTNPNHSFLLFGKKFMSRDVA
jgi:hypothetical protein